MCKCCPVWALQLNLLDITKQRCCIEWFVSGLYNYVNYIDIQQIVVAVPRQEQHSPLQGSCCPVWALQLHVLFVGS